MQGTIRILHCVETIGPGGVEQRRISIGKYLDKSLYRQTLTCTKVIGDFDKRLQQQGVEVEVLGIVGTPFNFAYYRKLFAVIRKVRPHIIHGAVFEGVLSAVVGGMWCRVPVIVIEETSAPIYRSWRGHLLFRVLSWFADAVVTTSPAVYDYVTKTAKVNPGKTHLITNGVEPPLAVERTTTEQLRKQLGFAPEDFIIGSVGRMLENPKLFSVLIKSFAALRKKYTNIRLLLVGDGKDKAMFEELAIACGVGDSVVFAGHQKDVTPYYTVMNVFAMVSAHEGFGMAIVEAMFFKLPVVGTRVGGIKTIVEEGKTGLLVPVNNEDELTKALTRLYTDPQLAAQAGEAGYQRAHSYYTASRYVRDLEKLYRQLLSR